MQGRKKSYAEVVIADTTSASNPCLTTDADTLVFNNVVNLLNLMIVS